MVFSYFLLILAADFLAAQIPGQAPLGRVLPPDQYPQIVRPHLPLTPHQMVRPHLFPRVVGGKDMEIEQAPWQVSLQVNAEHKCGGSIFSEWIIITAAHCFYRDFGKPGFRLLHDKEFIISAGSSFKRNGKIIAAVSAKWHHEGFIWTPTYILNDIGIMKLRSQLPISYQVRPIPLAAQMPFPGSLVLSTGWGSVVSQNRYFVNPETLQGAYIYIQSPAYCKAFIPWLSNEFICAGNPGYTICSGDSGGPLVFRNTLVGVASARDANCNGPGVYTNVAVYHNWLMHAVTNIVY